MKCFILALVCLASVAASLPAPVADKAEFGVWDADTNAVPKLLVTKTVPLDLGIVYGWRLHLTDNKASVRVKQVLTLPATPQTWGKNNALRLSGDKRTATFERQMQPKDGWIAEFIRVADGDPEGRHKLEVYVEGQLAQTFEFETKPDAPFPPGE